MTESAKGEGHSGTGPIAPARKPFQPEAFGKYYLLDPVAVGGMAEVFRAKTFGHSGFQKVLVIKRILPHFAENPEFVEMFIDEAKLSVELTHPNIVQIYDFGKIEEAYFIAMEAVAGKDLKSTMRRLAERAEHMPQELAAYVAHEVAKGLDYAHKVTDPMGLPLNIVHRDISPSNVLISYGGHIKIVDFGIAKAESATQMSESGVLKGKFQYMSPEQAQGVDLDHRSDVFALGICLWEMLTGHRLFRRPNEIESLEAVKACQVPLPSTYNPQIPHELDRICMVALARNPDHRYQEAGHFQKELEQFLLPTTPSGLGPHVSTWIRQRFGEEILQERERLDRGTQLATDLQAGAEPTGEMLYEDARALAKRSEGTKTVQRRRSRKKKTGVNWPLVGAISVVSLLIVAIIVLLILPLAPTTEPVTGYATLHVRVLPEGLPGVKIVLDGDPIPKTYDKVAPGVAHKLVISAPGRETRITKGLELIAGQVYVKEVQLGKSPARETPSPASRQPTQRTAKPTPTASRAAGTSAKTEQAPAPRESSSPRPARAFLDAGDYQEKPAEFEAPLIRFDSEPSGATVFVDGKKRGKTPLRWKEALPGQMHQVEYRLDGHRSVQAVVTGPDPGQSASLSRSLPPRVEVPMGRISILVNPGWARVFVDGEYAGTTPLLDHAVPAGNREIRLSNPVEEVDLSDTIKVQADRHTRRTFELAN